MELGVPFGKCYGNHENDIGFIRVLMHVFPVKLQPRKMQFELCVKGFFADAESAARNSCKPNRFQ